MKSQGAAKNEANNAAQTTVRTAETPAVKIDLSKVKVEPLFEEFVDFDTFSKSDFRVVKVKECEAVPQCTLRQEGYTPEKGLFFCILTQGGETV